MPADNERQRRHRRRRRRRHCRHLLEREPPEKKITTKQKNKAQAATPNNDDNDSDAKQQTQTAATKSARDTPPLAPTSSHPRNFRGNSGNADNSGGPITFPQLGKVQLRLEKLSKVQYKITSQSQRKRIFESQLQLTLQAERLTCKYPLNQNKY
ncbi:uncharacterized protein LOC116805227 [Drosophila grimshawi]|uniref:uncharacterized protein LOC116805227 n=1 Tax=Drosophila grimshawi TaxID=7222 RepID=UPI0013EF2867|nr:uncharacterized protein LOC116805227 [Drosophila grimshawi]